MTNLSFNNSRYTAMNNRQQTNSGLDESNRDELLGKLKTVFFQHFKQSVDDCCRRIDVEFGLQLGKNREKITKEHYIKSLEYLRAVRDDIEHNYLSKVNQSFDGDYQNAVNSQKEQLDFTKVALVSDDAVKENYAITAIIRLCEQAFQQELGGLNKYLATQQGKQVIANSQNPMSPERLVRALVEVVKPLRLNANGRIALYKAFAAHVFNQLGLIYRELIKECEIANSKQLYVVEDIKERVEPAYTNAEQPSAAFELLQKKLELWRLAHFPSIYDSISATGSSFYEHFEIQNALQVLQLDGNDSGSGEKKQSLKWQVLTKLEKLSFSVDVKSLAKHDEDLLDLVALIFDEIKRDKALDDAIKETVLRLEIPMASASLGKYSVFTGENNPVRQLLDDLFAAGMFLNADEHDDRLIQERIESAVKKLTKSSGFEFSGWVVEAGEFSDYLNKQKQRTQDVEKNSRQFMINKQALESSRKIVLITIENSIMGKALPATITDFLRNVWANVLQAAYADKDEQPEQWQKSVQAMDDLIISVMPPADDKERKQILKLLPGLITELRNGLKQISFDKSAQSRFFKDLAIWHIILMDKKEAKKTAGDIVADGALSAKGGQTDAEAIADVFTEQAERLAEGSWVALSTESGKKWGKLLWKGTEAMLFVSKNGIKIVEMQAADFAKKLRKGQAAIVKIDQKTVTERVLSELMSL
ncbi:MAG: DUF1631 domain-containing protein [Methylobacter sp.]|uniref:DUF1631 family protein n=1 Tax=Methylobacter sp. TaxID=2051955 RepID=UPI0025FDD7C7|nr:DUF1631 family protein [Methylobacter sp.]MCK9621054.1 DUF1631 domain-containing protein [Methylobacter sp.]